MNNKDLIKRFSDYFNKKKYKAIISESSKLNNLKNEDVLNISSLAFDQQAILEKNNKQRKKLQKKAIGYASLIQKRFPKSDKGYLAMGIVYQHQGKINESLDLYKKASRISPKKSFILLNLGNGYRAKKDYVQAEKLYNKATKYKQLKALAYINLVGLYKDTREIKKMNDCAIKALKILKSKTDTFSMEQTERLQKITKQYPK